MYLLYPFTSILHLFGVTRNGSSHSFILISSPRFFNLRLCLWFDLHRHLFLLVLFLLCGCDYNQEMEIQKSTCCHSKYGLFHPTDLLSAPHTHLRVSPVFVCLLVCLFVHGCTHGAVLRCELTA